MQSTQTLVLRADSTLFTSRCYFGMLDGVGESWMKCLGLT